MAEKYDNRKVFQKTFVNTSYVEIDRDVNEFIQKNECVGTQSHFQDGVQVRILFYKVKE